MGLSECGMDEDSTPTPRCEWGRSPIPGYSSRASTLFLSLVMAFLKVKCTSEMCFLLSCVKNSRFISFRELIDGWLFSALFKSSLFD